MTELVTGVDLVLTQLALATGRTLGDLGLADPPAVRGSAVELRVAAERVGSDGALLPAHGVATGLTWPSGPGVRVDTHLVEGSRVDGAFDSLVAKVVTHSHGGLAGALDKARRAALECSIDGVETTLPLLRERSGTADAPPPAWLDALGPCILAAIAVAVLLPEARGAWAEGSLGPFALGSGAAAAKPTRWSSRATASWSCSPTRSSTRACSAAATAGLSPRRSHRPAPPPR